jgi:hypothetical protein
MSALRNAFTGGPAAAVKAVFLFLLECGRPEGMEEAGP